MFIHDALLEIVTCGDTQISAADLRATLNKMETKNPNTHSVCLCLCVELSSINVVCY